MDCETNKIIWKDKKRFLGMPLSFTKYSIDDERLYLDKGFFTTTSDEILLYRILDIKVKRTFGQKIFGVGTITLYTADQTDRILELKNIKKAKDIQHLISKLVEKRRVERGVAGREMIGTGAVDADAVDHECSDLDGDGIPD